jgi:hypothetical protein
MISSPDPALAGRLPELRRIGAIVSDRRHCPEDGSQRIFEQTSSNHMPAEPRRPEHHLALPAASRRTGSDEKHYWLAAVADIIHSGRVSSYARRSIGEGHEIFP